MRWKRSNGVCQTPTHPLKCERKTQKNMHVFIRMETNGFPGKLTYKESYFTRKDFSLIWQL